MTTSEPSEMNNDSVLRDHRDFAWEYFKVHAQQRMSLFNFFVVFSSLATTCLVATFQERTRAHVVGLGIGIVLIAISFIFWKLDKRVRFLIKHAESALKWIEDAYALEDGIDEPHVLRLFRSEERRTASARYLTYSKCFGLAFVVFGIIGAAGIIISATCLGWDLRCLVAGFEAG